MLLCGRQGGGDGAAAAGNLFVVEAPFSRFTQACRRETIIPGGSSHCPLAGFSAIPAARRPRYRPVLGWEPLLARAWSTWLRRVSAASVIPRISAEVDWTTPARSAASRPSTFGGVVSRWRGLIVGAATEGDEVEVAGEDLLEKRSSRSPATSFPQLAGQAGLGGGGASSSFWR